MHEKDIDPRVYDLYDEYCHGRIDRRTFLSRSAAAVAGGLAMAHALLPNYAKAQTISFTDERIKAKYVTYKSPGGTSGVPTAPSRIASNPRSASRVSSPRISPSRR